MRAMYCGKCKKEMKETRGTHHYTECGLDNIVLNNIQLYECGNCGKTIPIITHIDGLHRVIANNLARKQEPLNGKELRFIRKILAMKASELAEVLGVTPQRISQWENEKGRVGKANDRLIKALYLYPELREALRLLTPTVESQLNLDFPTFLASIETRERSKEQGY